VLLGGALGSSVAVLGGGCGFLLNLQGACQGGIARILAFAGEALSGGGSLIGLLLGKAQGDLVGLNTCEASSGRGGIVIPRLGVDGGVAGMATLYGEGPARGWAQRSEELAREQVGQLKKRT
jgi:hypothetical protein